MANTTLDDILKKIAKENHPNWKGGITDFGQQIRHLDEYVLWRKAIFERDNYICQFCGKRGGILHADHIKRFGEILIEYSISTLAQAIGCNQLWDISNGRTLCEECHFEITYGYAGSWKVYKKKGEICTSS